MGERTGGRAGSEKESRARGCALLLRALAVLFLSVIPALPPSPAPPPARAQQVRAYLSADSVKVGERFRLSLVADHNFQLKARFPTAGADPGADSGAVGAATFGDLVVLGVRDSSRRYLGRAGMRRDSVVYEVTTFALDTARVASIPVAFAPRGSPAGDTARAATEERLLLVTSVLAPGVRAGRDSAGLKPMTPPAAFARPLWPWLLGGLGVGVLAALLAWLWWKREPEPEERAAPKRPPVPPAEAARRRLRRLEETTDLDDPGAAKPFYDDLSHTLRRYLMHRLGLHAFRQTTAELVEQLQHRTATRGALPETVPTRVRRVLEGADLAKFADQRPSADARRHALDDARAAIDDVEEALQPAVEEEEEEKGGREEETEAAT